LSGRVSSLLGVLFQVRTNRLAAGDMLVHLEVLQLGRASWAAELQAFKDFSDGSIHLRSGLFGATLRSDAGPPVPDLDTRLAVELVAVGALLGVGGDHVFAETALKEVKSAMKRCICIYLRRIDHFD